jgi:hypothetical protein
MKSSRLNQERSRSGSRSNPDPMDLAGAIKRGSLSFASGASEASSDCKAQNQIKTMIETTFLTVTGKIIKLHDRYKTLCGHGQTQSPTASAGYDPPPNPEKPGNPAERCNDKGLTRQITRQEPGRNRHRTRQSSLTALPQLRDGDTERAEAERRKGDRIVPHKVTEATEAGVLLPRGGTEQKSYKVKGEGRVAQKPSFDSRRSW